MQSKTEKDIVPEPVEPGGVHPELGGQIDSQRESTVHGVVEESPAQRGELSAVYLKWPLLSSEFLIFIKCAIVLFLHFQPIK